MLKQLARNLFAASRRNGRLRCIPRDDRLPLPAAKSSACNARQARCSSGRAPASAQSLTRRALRERRRPSRPAVRSAQEGGNRGREGWRGRAPTEDGRRMQPVIGPVTMRTAPWLQTFKRKPTQWHSQSRRFKDGALRNGALR
ncbi:unnamed protein product, partial [Prorocentrum cordatum]